MLRHLRYFLCIIFENDEKYIIGLSYTFNVHIGTLFLTKCNWVYIVCVKLSRAIAWQKKTPEFLRLDKRNDDFYDVLFCRLLQVVCGREF